jgi:hypothetical protein
MCQDDFSASDSYRHIIGIARNHKDLIIVARNAILLIAFGVDDIEEVVDSMIHAWYLTSKRLTRTLATIFQVTTLPWP